MNPQQGDGISARHAFTQLNVLEDVIHLGTRVHTLTDVITKFLAPELDIDPDECVYSPPELWRMLIAKGDSINGTTEATELAVKLALVQRITEQMLCPPLTPAKFCELWEQAAAYLSARGFETWL